jgi:hypothetical protein
MSSSACNGEAESNMKIYLLVMLMSALLMAIRFTTAREHPACIRMRLSRNRARLPPPQDFCIPAE